MRRQNYGYRKPFFYYFRITSFIMADKNILIISSNSQLFRKWANQKHNTNTGGFTAVILNSQWLTFRSLWHFDTWTCFLSQFPVLDCLQEKDAMERISKSTNKRLLSSSKVLFRSLLILRCQIWSYAGFFNFKTHERFIGRGVTWYHGKCSFHCLSFFRSS